jgi:hypothetical protein
MVCFVVPTSTPSAPDYIQLVIISGLALNEQFRHLGFACYWYRQATGDLARQRWEQNTVVLLSFSETDLQHRFIPADSRRTGTTLCTVVKR